MSRSFLPALVAISAIACSAPAATPGAAEGSLTLPVRIFELLQRQTVQGAVWVVLEEDDIRWGTMGVSGPGSASPSPDTFFHLASISKPVTATAVLKLAEQGRVKLDAPYKTYVKVNSADPRADRMTVRDLIEHRSGLRNYAHRFDAPDMGPQAIQKVAAEPLEFDSDPGGKSTYRNRNYQLLGALVEQVTGEPFERFAEREILRAGAANDLVYGCSNAPAGRVATGYAIAPSGAPVPSELSPVDRKMYSAGGLCGTAKAIARWALDATRCAHRRAVLNCTTLQQIRPAPNRNVAGWYNKVINGTEVFYHAGNDVGYSGVLFSVPEKKVAVAVLTNSNVASAEMAAQALLSPYVGNEIMTERSEPSATERRSWLGRYYNPQLGWARIEQDGADLYFVHQSPEFDYELVRTRLFPKPDWNPDGYYYAGTFRGGPMVLDAVITASNPRAEIRTSAGTFVKIDDGRALYGTPPAVAK